MDPLTGFEIFTGIIARFWLVWILIILVFAISIKTKRKTALYGKLLTAQSAWLDLDWSCFGC